MLREDRVVWWPNQPSREVEAHFAPRDVTTRPMAADYCLYRLVILCRGIALAANRMLGRWCWPRPRRLANAHATVLPKNAGTNSRQSSLPEGRHKGSAARDCRIVGMRRRARWSMARLALDPDARPVAKQRGHAAATTGLGRDPTTGWWTTFSATRRRQHARGPGGAIRRTSR